MILIVKNYKIDNGRGNFRKCRTHIDSVTVLLVGNYEGEPELVEVEAKNSGYLHSLHSPTISPGLVWPPVALPALSSTSYSPRFPSRISVSSICRDWK
jgi:hypothetical protein